jgi:hypothetical protein
MVFFKGLFLWPHCRVENRYKRTLHETRRSDPVFCITSGSDARAGTLCSSGHVAQAFAWPAHGAQPIHEPRLKPYLALALVVRLAL